MAYAWLDGRLVPADEARVSIFDRGYLQGDGCFETIRIHRGAPFRLGAHLARMRRSLEVLGVSTTFSDVEFRDNLRSVLESNDLMEGLLRITVTSGGAQSTAQSMTISSRPLPEIPKRVVLKIVHSARRVPGPMSEAKTISRAVESAASREAVRSGAFDAVLLNLEGRVCETASRNIFVARDGVLVTPPTSEGALPGITRAAVIELAAAFQFQLEESRLSVEALFGADEVFITGSGVGVLSVHQVDGHGFAVGKGSRAKMVQTAYAGLLDQESRWY